MKYSIVLIKTRENTTTDYFNRLKINELMFINAIETDSLTIYVLGVFYNKHDALKYLDYAKEKGFNDAYIVNQYELNNESKSWNIRNRSHMHQPDKK